MNTLRRGGSLFFLFLISPISATAQKSEIGGSPQCSDCLRASRTVVLGNPLDVTSLGGLPRVVRSSDHYFLISPLAHPTDLLVYDTNGRLVGDLGRPGQGPGEFRSVWYLGEGRGDSILVGELGNRFHLFSGDGRFGRTVALVTAGRRGRQLPTGEIVVAGQIMTRDRVGIPIHLYSSAGERLVSFGGPDRIIPTQPLAGTRVISLGSDTTLWMARPEEYRVEEWTSWGRRMRSVERIAEWFPALGERAYVATARGVRPDPTITGLRWDDGLLWVAITVAAQDWAAVPRNQDFTAIQEMNRQWDTRIEVIDVANGRVRASIRLDEFVRGFSGPREVYTLREDGGGMTFVDIWALSIVGQ